MGGRFDGAEKGSRDCSLPLCLFTGAGGGKGRGPAVSDRNPAIVRLAFICRSRRGLRSTKLVVASRFHLPWG